MNTSNTASLPQPIKRRKGLAIASLVLGIWGLVSLGLLFVKISVPSYLLLDEVYWSRSLVGMVFGIIAIVKTNRNPAVYACKGIAIAGIVTNSVKLIIDVVLIAGSVAWYR